MTKQKTAPECDYLPKVSVRLLNPEERERFDALLESDHYLHSARVGGQSLRYVAEVEGEWIALVAFSGAAPHTKARECEARWTPLQRARRTGEGISWETRAVGVSPRKIRQSA